jgi:hypothetical protein
MGRRTYLADQKTKKFRRLKGGGGRPPPTPDLLLVPSHPSSSVVALPLGIPLGTGEVINVETGEVLPKGTIYRRLEWPRDAATPRTRE